MLLVIVLVVGLSRIESLELLHLRHYRHGVGFLAGQLTDKLLGNGLLLRVAVKYDAPILSANVSALTIQLGRVMGAEVDFQNLPKTD